MGLEHGHVRRARSRHGWAVAGVVFLASGGALVAALRAHTVPRLAQAGVRPPEDAWASAPATTAIPTSSRGRIPGGALSAVATLGQSKLVRGSDGELLLHVGVDATDDPATRQRRPIDFALVLDTSGSMEEENKIVLLKRATKELLAKLGSDDRVAVVTFANDARTVFPLEVLGDEAKRAAYATAVEALEPGGGTNISEGLLAGAEELRKAEPRAGSARRIVLMTDGLANFGIQEPAELAKLVSGLSREGFTLSTIGLGTDYSGKVLADMADAGGGTFYDAARADRLAGIYEAEVNATRALVARETRLEIVPPPGVTVESVYFWPTSDSGSGARSVALGDLSAGRHLKVVARLRVPTSGRSSSLPVASVSLRYDDVRGKSVEKVTTTSVGLGVELAADESVARASVATEIQGELDRVAVADGLERAQDLVRAGKTDEARALLASVRSHNGGERVVTWKTADGVEGSLDLVAYSQAVFHEGDAGTSSGDRYFETSAAGVIFYTTNGNLVMDANTCTLPVSGLTAVGK